MQTTLELVPDIPRKGGVTDDRRVAVGEAVAVTVRGLGPCVATGLRLRIRFLNRDCAVFPLRDGDAWTLSGDNDADAQCVIDLNTAELRAALQFMGDAAILPCLAVLDSGADAEVPVLYCAIPLQVGNWLPLTGLPDPVRVTDWVSRCDAIEGELERKAEELSRRIDEIVVPDPVKPDWNATPGSDAEILNKPAAMPPTSHTHTKSDVTDFAHTHAKSEITDFPTSMAPTAHAATHMAGGADALSPSSIGAAAATHAHGMSDVTGLENALSGAASVADATLNGRGVDGSGFGEWTCEINGQVVVPESITYDEAGMWTFDLGPEDDPIQIPGDENSTELTKVILGQTFTATRTALPGYILGSQTDKPVPKLSDVPAVVAPSTAAADAGKAADAKATGDALAGKLDTSGGNLSGNITFLGGAVGSTGVGVAAYGIQRLVRETPELIGAITFTLPNNGGVLAITSDIPASETWTFEVDDGQGGTETVTKSVAVFAQNAQSAQGGA